MLSRRSFLRTALTATGVAIVAPELLVPAEPRRRVWQVGAQLVRPADLDVVLYTDHGYTYSPSRAVYFGDLGKMDDTAPALREAFANENRGRGGLWESLTDNLKEATDRMAEQASLYGESTLYVQRVDPRTGVVTLGSEPHSFVVPEPTGTLFGIKPGGYPSPEGLYHAGQLPRVRNAGIAAFNDYLKQHMPSLPRDLGDEDGV